MKTRKMRIMAIGLVLLMSTPAVLAADYDHHWAKEAIDKWSGYDIIKGYENGGFKPNNPITRAELASLLVRVFQLTETKGATNYLDITATPDKWYVQDVNKASALGLMHIDGVFFEPNQPATREEAAYAIAKAYQLVGDEKAELNFSDQDRISSWAKGAVVSLVSKGYITGTPEGSFMPQGTLTRAEIVTMLNNITTQLITKPGTYTNSVKGNVVVNSAGITLKDMKIEGNLYLTQGIKDTAMVLENVTVTGKVYLNGGNVKMSGQYNVVELATMQPIELVTGSIKELIVNKAGSVLTLGLGADVATLTQNQPITLAGQGLVDGQEVGQMQAAKVTEAGVYISGQYVALPIEGDSIVIDIPALSSQFAPIDRLEGLKISSNSSGAIISSNWGSMNAGTRYSFKAAEDELGLIREIALQIGVSPTLVISAILGQGELTIGGLLADYESAQSMASALGYTLEDTYTFERYISSAEGNGSPIYITMQLQ